MTQVRVPHTHFWLKYSVWKRAIWPWNITRTFDIIIHHFIARPLRLCIFLKFKRLQMIWWDRTLENYWARHLHVRICMCMKQTVSLYLFCIIETNQSVSVVIPYEAETCAVFRPKLNKVHFLALQVNHYLIIKECF